MKVAVFPERFTFSNRSIVKWIIFIRQSKGAHAVCKTAVLIPLFLIKVTQLNILLNFRRASAEWKYYFAFNNAQFRTRGTKNPAGMSVLFFKQLCCWIIELARVLFMPHFSPNDVYSFSPRTAIKREDGRFSMFLSFMKTGRSTS